MISTTNDYQKLQAWDQNLYVFISGCLSLWQSLGVSFFSCWTWPKPHICRWNCHPACHGSRDISISAFNGRNACHFQLLNIVTITWGHFIRTHCGQKYLTCRCNFDAISCSSSCITISGFGSHVAISGCH